MEEFDKATGFLIADPVSNYFKNFPEHSEVKDSSASMILSSSGWRKVFAEDGNEESRTERISDTDYILGAVMALGFAQFITAGREKPAVILLGMDSRFTGPAIADSMTRVLIAEGIEVRSLFIVAAPEIMAYSAVDPEIDGFVYISASHNPVGHNGVKFGTKGGVYGGRESSELISAFKELIDDPGTMKKVEFALGNYSKEIYRKIIENIPEWKKKSFDAYLDFSKMVIADSDSPDEITVMETRLQKKAENRNIGIISELNGSARTLSIDRKILENFGIAVTGINDNPREIVHRIVPEGFSLDQCREELEKKYIEDPGYILGYVPDNDGDRGNLVYIDEKTGKAEILEAQTVFALAVLSELAFMTLKNDDAPLAIAINGPTSMRIDAIAEAFGVEIFRAEVGEANVVNLAKSLRKKGYRVRILGEGSNGGNITFPASVRDPINTIFSIVKLLLFKDLFEVWCSKSGNSHLYRDNYGIRDIIESLPSFTTTSAYDNRAIMKINSADHALLKKRYEEIFPLEWEKNKLFLKETFGICGWKEINYEGEEEKSGFGPAFRSGSEKGGLKIIFSDAAGEDTDYIWMRGSGTEPVFRILADCKGNNPEREEWLLKWQRTIIEKADR